MAVVQANYPVAMDTDPVTGYPMPRETVYVKGATGNVKVVNSDGSTNVNLLGRNYQEIALFNGLAILDTLLKTGTTMTVNTLAGQANILVYNTHDQALTVTIVIKNTLGQAFNVYSGSVPSGGTLVLTSANIPVLATPLYQMYATAQATTAPTTGALSVTYGSVQA